MYQVPLRVPSSFKKNTHVSPSLVPDMVTRRSVVPSPFQSELANLSSSVNAPSFPISFTQSKDKEEKSRSSGRWIREELWGMIWQVIAVPFFLRKITQRSHPV